MVRLVVSCAVSCAVTLAVIALAPVIVIAGEPLRRYYLKRLNRPPRWSRSTAARARAALRRSLRQAARHDQPVAGQAHADLGSGTGSQPYGVGWRPGLARVVIANPVLIALTAPGRWTIDRVGDLRSGGSGGGSSGGGFGRRGGRGGDWPPPADVREPRRPRPTAPAGAVALAEPRQQRRVIRIRKAIPQALSEPVRRAGSRLRHLLRHRLRQMARLLRARVSHWPAQL